MHTSFQDLRVTGTHAAEGAVEALADLNRSNALAKIKRPLLSTFQLELSVGNVNHLHTALGLV